jgi:DNA polymerase/3'-5' exonuclease PolX
MELPDNNKIIADILNEIGLYYEVEGDQYRKKSFLNGADIVRNYKADITSGDDIINIHGIGKSISEVINEYLETGKVQRLEDLRAKHEKQKETFEYFQSFYGIGAVKAAELVKLGYTTLPQLWDNKDKLLTQAQQDGIFWRNHIKVRIPRQEMNIINDKISLLFNDYDFNWVMAGSYRREEESSGDIDILIENNGKITMEIIYQLLKQYIPTVLAKGPKRLAGIFRLSDEYYGHRIDILMVEPENWPFALLHFTGSDKFNILMSDRAKSFGWKLGMYDLIDLENGTKIPANDEKDIFDALGVKYLEPIQRTKTLSSLEFY